MQFYARDIMSPRLVTVQPGMTCREVLELFRRYRISGAPVVGGDGDLQGVITITDLIPAAMGETTPSDFFMREATFEEALSKHGFHVEVLTEGFVSELMNRNVHSAFPDTTVEELAGKMFKARIHRLIVVEGESQRAIGMITTFDLLKILADGYSSDEFIEEVEGWLGKTSP